MCTCIGIYIYLPAYTRINMHILLHIVFYNHTHVYYTSVHFRIDASSRIHAHICTYVLTRVHVYIYTDNTHICIYHVDKYTHIHLYP